MNSNNLTPKEILNTAFNIGNSHFPNDYDTLRIGMLKKLNLYYLKKALEIIGEDESGATENFAIKRQNHNNALRAKLRKAFKDALGEGEE